MKKYYSIIRTAEYENLSKLELNGVILDVGGGKTASYHPLIKGNHTFFSLNIAEAAQPDMFVDIEKPFPIESNTYDHAVCLNVLEHIYEFENTFSEQARCVKSGGKIVIAVPFMHHIHGSPDDYIRYTESALRKMSTKFGCEVVSIVPLGAGLFSLIFQTIGTALPTKFLQSLVKPVCVGMDTFFNKISQNYRKLSGIIPLGYFVILQKK